MKKIILFISIFAFFSAANAQTLTDMRFVGDSTHANINGTAFIKPAKDSTSAELKISMGTSTMPVTSNPRTLGKDEPLGKALYGIKGVKSVQLGYTTITISLDGMKWPDVSDDVLDGIQTALWSNPKGGRKMDGAAMH